MNDHAKNIPGLVLQFETEAEQYPVYRVNLLHEDGNDNRQHEVNAVTPLPA
jgi:hypothetical protein